MDISHQLDGIVAGLVKDIEAKLNTKVERIINDYLKHNLDTYDYETKLNWLASLKLDGLISSMEINKGSIQKRLDQVTETMFTDIKSDCKTIATDHIKKRLYNDIDINQVVRDIVADEITRRIKRMDFPEHSIPGTAINPETLKLSGNSITGGVIQQFSSSGIEDKSTQVQMTLIDEGVVVENKIVALGLDIHGTTVLRVVT